MVKPVEETKPEEAPKAVEANPEEPADASSSSWTDWLWPFGSDDTEETKPAN